MEDTLVKWLENQGPLWVIYALTIVGIVSVSRQLFRYLPILFEKHVALLERTTKSVADSAEAINRLGTDVRENSSEINQTQFSISEAATPFSKALVAMAASESKEEVRQHLDEMEDILAKYTQKRQASS
jgi:hypothetical protein